MDNLNELKKIIRNKKPVAAFVGAGLYILNYLDHVARKNSATPSDEITNALIEIVNSLIDYILKNECNSACDGMILSPYA